jgi:glycosyltransferase involved in cell wall biosynthesis
LRVGLNLLYLAAGSGGAGTYARELLPALLAVEPDLEVTAFVSAEAPADFVDAGWDGRVRFVRFPVTVTHGPPGNFALTTGIQWGAIPWLAARRRLEVVHGLANVTPLLAPRVATVVTLLDLIWIHHPQTLARAATAGMKLVAPPSARFADRVIALSHAAADDLVATLGLERSRIDVVHLGTRRVSPCAAAEPEDVVRRELGLGADPVVLCVGQKREHKNLAGLVRALARMSTDRVSLVLPGSPTPYERELRALAESLGVGARVVFLSWVSEARLEALYRLATCFVSPSLREGFGLPVLEAMARDVPVACSNRSSLPEVAGDAALLFDPTDPTGIAAALDRLLADPSLRATLVARGRARCAQFPWEATARATLHCYRRAIARKHR